MTAMAQAFAESRIKAEHKDRIHDISFDYYGTRMATCSSDQNVKVWDLDEKQQWKCTTSWKSHRASAWRVTWAHPEFGQVLATCSFDRTATIWQETIVEATQSDDLEHVWVHKANLVDSTTSVKDVKFSPHYLGLQLATCSAKGIVYIYEATDIMNLTHWTMQHQINCDMPCSCLSWSTNKSHNPMIAIGSDDSSPGTGGKVVIYECNSDSHEWVMIHRIAQLVDPVNDLKFAPNVGLSYHMLAIASNDLCIYHLKPNDDGEDINNILNNVNNINFHSTFSHSGVLNVSQVVRFTDHNCNVLRVAWNDFGNLLVSNGDDGQILVWMENYMQKWKAVGFLKHSSSSKSGYSLQGFNGLSMDNAGIPYY